MKTRLLTGFVLMLLFFAGCSLEESNLLPSNTSTSKTETSKSYVRFDLANNSQSLLVNELRHTPSHQMSYRASGNSSANGHITPIEGYPGTFSAALNNGGTHGSAIINLPWAGLHLEIECLIVEDNVAVIEGEIKQIFYDYCDGCMQVGQYFTFEVIDNGEGQNAPTDQVGSYVIWSDEPLCGDIPPNSPEWGPPLDAVGQGDQIQVK